MKDKLKKFVEQNRAEFEMYETDLDPLWSQIDKGVQSKKGWSPFYKNALKIAASLFIMFTIGMAFFIGKKSAELETHGIALHNVSPEMAETESYYSGMIQDKMNFINKSKAEISDDTWESIHRLDADYEELKKDLQDKADNEEVINAMIMYYRLKLELLEKIAGKINENKEANENYSI